MTTKDEQQQELAVDFDRQLVAGSVKPAMAAVKATSRDLWSIEIDAVRILPNFNVRTQDDAYHAHIRSLADSMLTEGFYQHKPLAGYVAREGGKQIVYITDGHCRYYAARLAISEGAEIERLPMVVSAQGSSIEDLTVELVRSASGKPLSPYEIGVVCKRLSRFGWDVPQIANRLGFTVQYVTDLLFLMSAGKDVRDMVQNGLVSAAAAIQELRTYGDKAGARLAAALERAKAAGGTRVTPKHLPPSFKKQVSRAAPELFTVLRDVRKDPGYSNISDSLREKLDQLMGVLEEAQASDGNNQNLALDA